MAQDQSNRPSLSLVCEKTNDIYVALQAGGYPFVRYDDAEEAFSKTSPGGAVLLLADGYPAVTRKIKDEWFTTAREKKIRLYVEYPASLPGVEVGEIRQTKWQRGIIASDAFQPAVSPMQIVAIHDCHYVATDADNPHIVIGRVAGFDRAVYGLPAEAHPILFESIPGQVLVATTKLSQCITARYAPTDIWQGIWRWILQWCQLGGDWKQFRWEPCVRPTYSSKDVLPKDVEDQAMRRNADWFLRAKMFIHPDWEDRCPRKQMSDDGELLLVEAIGAGPERDWPCGDGSRGMIEGADGTIRHDGSQYWRYYLRGDCMGETAMLMSLVGAVDKRADYQKIAGNLNDYIYFNSVFCKERRADPNSPSYGLIAWTGNDVHGGVYYGDDNARCILGSLTAAAVLNEGRWNESLLRAILANLRTTGVNGFRGERLEDDDMQANGWRSYWNGDVTHYAPHFESWLWACYFWVFSQTGYTPLQQRGLTGILNMMSAYPHQWTWTNGIQQERARMLLPLSWLVRISDRQEHRQWLRKIAEDILAMQDVCGAIREEVGSEGLGRYGPPKSNEDYGTTEAPLIQENGDPLCDMLYTTNYALIGLHEAAAATGEAWYSEAEDRLIEFLCRIQVRSECHPELDGAWFRAFDFRRWDYWASSADLGWSAWSIESGWTQTWIASVLALRRMKMSLWELLSNNQIVECSDRLIKEMFAGKKKQ